MQKLVELQGGKIHVISELGLGSTFIFNLFLEVPDESVKANEVKTVESYSYVGLEGKKILIAEDNKINFSLPINSHRMGYNSYSC